MTISIVENNYYLHKTLCFDENFCSSVDYAHKFENIKWNLKKESLCAGQNITFCPTLYSKLFLFFVRQILKESV